MNAVLAGSAELIGGGLLVLGLFSRLATIPLLFLTFVVCYTVGHGSITALVSQFNPAPFFRESVFLFGYATLIVFCFGPGKISLDYWFAREEKG